LTLEAPIYATEPAVESNMLLNGITYCFVASHLKKFGIFCYMLKYLELLYKSDFIVDKVTPICNNDHIWELGSH